MLDPRAPRDGKRSVFWYVHSWSDRVSRSQSPSGAEQALTRLLSRMAARSSAGARASMANWATALPPIASHRYLHEWLSQSSGPRSLHTCVRALRSSCSSEWCLAGWQFDVALDGIAKAITTGYYHTCALMVSGAARSRGRVRCRAGAGGFALQSLGSRG